MLGKESWVTCGTRVDKRTDVMIRETIYQEAVGNLMSRYLTTEHQSPCNKV